MLFRAILSTIRPSNTNGLGMLSEFFFLLFTSPCFAVEVPLPWGAASTGVEEQRPGQAMILIFSGGTKAHSK